MTRPVGNKFHRAKLRKHIYQIHRLWSELVLESQRLEDPWYKLGEILAYRDSLMSLKSLGFIEDFSTSDVTFGIETREI